MSVPRLAVGPRRSGSARGVGLIEVLVALLVLSIGFLAAGNMQLRALQDGQDAYHRSQARLLLDDMMDRMRNNPRGVRDGAYDGKETGGTSTVDCRSSDCTPAQLAERDIAEWSARLDPDGAAAPALPPASDGGTLRAASGTISMPQGGVYTLALRWWGMGEDGALEERVIDASFVP